MNYCIYGNESYLMRAKLKEIIKEHVGEDASLNTVFYDASANDFQISSLINDAWTIPFFAETKVIVLQNAFFLSSSDTLKENDAKLLSNYLSDSNNTTILVFYGEFESMDARKKICKEINKTCRVFPLMKMAIPQFKGYVLQALKQNKITLNQEAMELLMERLPQDLESFHHELEKMKLYASHYQKKDIEKLITRPMDEDVFHLVNSVVNKDLKSALHLWNDLWILNKDPIYLVSLLASQFRLMFQVITLLNQGVAAHALAQELAVHPFRVKKAEEATRGLSANRILGVLNELAILDQAFKSGTLERKLGFEMFLIKVTR